MRVTWVHPSWRDLVIEYLASNDDARERFLRGCSLHGALLALSLAGGQAGQRRLPLLKHDRDWDTLTDRVYELEPVLEQAELVGLLDGIAQTIGGLESTTAGPETDALARSLLSRVATVWTSARAPIPLPELEAWLALATLLSPRPPVPSIAVTWAELLPARAPDFSDGASLERFADWLTVAELLFGYDPKLLDQLGFPGRSRQFIDNFLSALERDVLDLRATDADQAIRALARIPRLIRSLAERADQILYWLESRPHAQPPEYAQWSTPYAPHPREQAGHVDVQRVLRDL